MPRDADGLTLRQSAFVIALLDRSSPRTFGNLTRAYQAAYPSCTYNAARADACRLVAKANIQAVLMSKTLSVEEMGNRLKKCMTLSKRLMEHDDPSVQLSAAREARSTVMDYATLTGQLVRKAEVHTVSDDDHRMLASIVGEVVALPASERPSLPAPQPTASLPPSVSEQVSSIHEVRPSSASESASVNPTPAPATRPASSESGLTPTPPLG